MTGTQRYNISLRDRDDIVLIHWIPIGGLL